MEHRRLYEALRTWAVGHDIAFAEQRLGAETPGVFDGLSVTMNPTYDLEQRCWYLVHSLGSIVRWAVSYEGSRAIFEELRAAKKGRAGAQARLEQAVEQFRAFEEAASEYAVRLLAELGFAEAEPPYTIFARADLEAMTQYHREGHAPIWRDFFARWQAEVRQGERVVVPFRPRLIPPFRPVRIPTQEVVQEHDGQP